jgi:hypothetical protein
MLGWGWGKSSGGFVASLSFGRGGRTAGAVGAGGAGGSDAGAGSVGLEDAGTMGADGAMEDKS